MRRLAILTVVSLASVSLAQSTPTTKPAQEVLKGMLTTQPRNEGKPVNVPGSPHATDARSGKGATAPAAPVVNVLREGTYIVDRTGRLIRGADGQQWEFTFDADGKTMQDPPVVVLPNLKLMGMEAAMQGNSRNLRFRITGMVTEYRSRNYILLEKAVVVPETSQF